MAEVRKGGEIPEEVKNQMVDGKKRVISIPIPAKEIVKIDRAEKEKQQLFNEFFNLSLRKQGMEKKLMTIYAEIGKREKVKKEETQKAFKKLRLYKQLDRQWQIKGTDFVGIYNPKPKNQPPKNKK